MTTVYWHIVKISAGCYDVEFWMKPDTTKKFTERFVKLDEELMRNRLVSLLGLKRFSLEQAKIPRSW